MSYKADSKGKANYLICHMRKCSGSALAPTSVPTNFLNHASWNAMFPLHKDDAFMEEAGDVNNPDHGGIQDYSGILEAPERGPVWWWSTMKMPIYIFWRQQRYSRECKFYGEQLGFYGRGGRKGRNVQIPPQTFSLSIGNVSSLQAGTSSLFRRFTESHWSSVEAARQSHFVLVLYMVSCHPLPHLFSMCAWKLYPVLDWSFEHQIQIIDGDMAFFPWFLAIQKLNLVEKRQSQTHCAFL